MSRLIPGRSVSDSLSQRTAEDGRLIFTIPASGIFQGKLTACLVRSNRLLGVHVVREADSRIGSVFLGKIKNKVKNINACFVEIAGGQLCYLPMSEAQTPFLTNRSYDGRLLEGDELPVQIIRDAQKTKQAAVTTRVTLAGKSVVFAAGSDRVGFSSRLSREQKKELKDFLIENGKISKDGRLISDSPVSLGAVIRTEAARVSREELLAEFDSLHRDFLQLFKTAACRTCFSCLREADLPEEEALTAFAEEEYTQIVTDLPEVYERLLCRAEKGGISRSVRLYEDASYSLSALYGLPSKLESALNSRVWLKSGGYLVIEYTEALTVIDVNTGKYSADKAAAETFYRINMEACEEIALQLRLRNCSGIILIDFINMDSPEREQELLERMRSLTRKDRIPTRVIDITPLGLMELTRKKCSPPLRELLSRKRDSDTEGRR